MAAYVLAVTADGHRRGQEACIEVGLINVCLKHLQGSTYNDVQTEPLYLQWLCLCLGKLWEDFAEAQVLGLQADAPAIFAPLLTQSQPEVRAASIFALGTLLDVGFDTSMDDIGEDEDYGNEEKTGAEVIMKSLLSVVSDASPLVRAEVAVALARFAFGHKVHLKSLAAAYLKSQSNSMPTSLPSSTVQSSGSGYTTPTCYVPHGSVVPSPNAPLLRVVGDSPSISHDGRVSTSSHVATPGFMHGSPLPDGSSHHSDSGRLGDAASDGVVNHIRPRPLENSLYTKSVQAMFALAKDPSPRVAGLGCRLLSIIGIDQVFTKSVESTVESTTSPGPSSAGLNRSSSWFDMSGGRRLPVPFRTPPVSPPQSSFLRGLRRVYSLDFRHRPMNSQDSGSADPLLGSGGSSRASEHSSIPQSTIYNWSCGHFSKPLLSADDDNEENISRREEKEKLALDLITKSQHCSVNRLHNQIATWDTEFESGTRTALLHPFSPVVIAADESEWIRVWNYKEATLLNSFDNHGYPDKGISKICLVNELDESLLLVASSDGNIRIWKEYTARGQQKLVSAFSSLQGLRPGSHSVNAVVDWQQQSGYLFASGNISSIMAWDLDKEQLVNTSPIYSDCSISAIQSQLVRRDAAKQFSYHSQTLCPKWQFDYAVCSPLRQRSLFVQPDLIPKWKELLGLAFNLDFNQQR
ncbi:regulatory-associated protein of TOR 1-like isoform X2 [Solanum pennellii]|nr:regulatory-associated protein of TOR 1-like isoform X2 [Solanum pennellii]